MECKKTEAHRIAEVVRHTWRSFSSNFPAQEGCSVQSDYFENLHRWRLHNALCNLFHCTMIFIVKANKNANIFLFTVVSEYCKLLYIFISVSRK